MTESLERLVTRALEIADGARTTANEALTTIRQHIDYCNRRESGRLEQDRRDHEEAVAHRKDVKESLDRFGQKLDALSEGRRSDQEKLWQRVAIAALTIAGVLLAGFVYLYIHGPPYAPIVPPTFPHP